MKRSYRVLTNEGPRWWVFTAWGGWMFTRGWVDLYEQSRAFLLSQP